MADKKPLKLENGQIKQFAATDTIPLNNLPSTVVSWSAWSAQTPITITAVTTNPTKATTRQYDYIQSRYNGNDVQVRFLYQQQSGAGGAIGSGNYLFTLPDSYSFDTSLQPVYTGTDVDDVTQYSLFGIQGGMASSLKTYTSSHAIIPYSATKFRLYLMGPNYPKDFISSTRYELNNNFIVYTGLFTFVKA